MQMNLFDLGNENLLQQEKEKRAFDFLVMSLAWLDGCKYKSVGKYMIEAWEKHMKNLGFIQGIEFSTEKLYAGKQSMRVLIIFPWDGERHLCFWLDNHKTRFDDLKKTLEKYKEIAKKKLEEPYDGTNS